MVYETMFQPLTAGKSVRCVFWKLRQSSGLVKPLHQLSLSGLVASDVLLEHTQLVDMTCYFFPGSISRPTK